MRIFLILIKTLIMLITNKICKQKTETFKLYIAVGCIRKQIKRKKT